MAIELKERREIYSGKKKKVLKQAFAEHEMTYERPFEVIDLHLELLGTLTVIAYSY